MRYIPDAIRFECLARTMDGRPHVLTAEVEAEVFGANHARGSVTVRLTPNEIEAIRAIIDPAITRFIGAVSHA